MRENCKEWCDAVDYHPESENNQNNNLSANQPSTRAYNLRSNNNITNNSNSNSSNLDLASSNNSNNNSNDTSNNTNKFHPATILNYLHQLGFRRCSYRFRPLIPSTEAALKRLYYCVDNIDTDFKHLLFVDETIVYCGPNNTHVWKLPHDPPINQEIAKFPKKHMFFAGISWYQKTPLVEVEDNLNSDGYIALIDENLRKTQLLHCNELCQDGASSHTAGETMNYLDSWDIRVNQLPPYSPELNPIEKAWGWLKQRVNQRNPQNDQQLFEFVRDEWGKLDQATIRGWIEHYATVIAEIIEHKGRVIPEKHHRKDKHSENSH